MLLPPLLSLRLLIGAMRLLHSPLSLFALPSCFDWWGYTGSLYGVQEGVQVRFVKNMIDALFTA